MVLPPLDDAVTELEGLTADPAAQRFWVVTDLTLGLLGLVLYLPVIADLFLFQPLAWEHLLTAMALSAMSVLWFEAIKLSRRQKPSP